MTYSVYQHWDPLKVCVVGKSYPPEFYSWIRQSKVRKLFEKIAEETEQDYLGLVSKLQEFNVEVLRPELGDLEQYLMPDDKHYRPPPMTPRDICIMIGQTFYHHFTPRQPGFTDPYQGILDHVQSQQNHIRYVEDLGAINGSTVSRLGRDLYFGTERYDQDIDSLRGLVRKEFPDYRTHVVNTGGHIDGTYCPVAPGLIFSIFDAPNFADTFPGWEVVYLENQSWGMIEDWAALKFKNNGKWWIPGFEQDQDVIYTVERWLKHWVGYVEETVFDVNMLMLDPKNILMLSHNQKVVDTLSRYGITAHIVPFRHRYFWDGGLHCITADLDRQGDCQDLFASRLQCGD